MQKTIQYIKSQLVNQYAETEIHSFIYLIFEHVLQYSKLDIHLKSNEVLPAAIVSQIYNIVTELKQFKPIQYILSTTFFYDSIFKVNSSVLIPRQETEELVDWIIKSNRINSPVILDIGTGSGCIAISLVKNITESKVYALDVSSEALSTASENAKYNDVKVQFFQVDILNWSEYKENFSTCFDIIISNPPYICESEKNLMLPNVLDNEPHLALFVPDLDPLMFYRSISNFSLEYLKPSGLLYFEINERFGNEIVIMLNKIGFSSIEIKRDINGKDRMVRCEKK
jgi:release factor glutamine methyltransferase